jgi:outer membrane protein assembly factor BamD
LVKKLTVLFLSLFLVACAANKKLIPEEPEKGAFEWYNSGIQSYINHDYVVAEHDLRMVREQHPNSIYAKKAYLKLGDVYFAKDEHILAREAYRRFIKYYPRSPDAVYAQYKIATSFWRCRNSYDKDQTPVIEALKAFVNLKKDHPSSSFACQADTYIMQCVDEIYRHELFVSKFYFRLHDYNAALNRLVFMSHHFSDLNFTDEMLYLLTMSYYYLNKREDAQLFFNELKRKYPQSRFVEKIKDKIEK